MRHDETVRKAVDDRVRRQVAAGIDVVSDGEMSKIGYATHVKDRFSGFAGEGRRRGGGVLVEAGWKI